jgi:hypothetical protein
MKPSHLLTSHQRWTKYAFARTATGVPCSPFAKDAARWDLQGAMMCYTGLPQEQMVIRLRNTLTFAVWAEDNAKSQFPCLMTLDEFNDTTSFAWVVQALKESNL